MTILLLVPTEGKQRSAALVTRAGDQWSLIFLKRLWLHFFLRGRATADPGTGRLSGSTKQRFSGFGRHSTSCPFSSKQRAVRLKMDSKQSANKRKY